MGKKTDGAPAVESAPSAPGGTTAPAIIEGPKVSTMLTAGVRRNELATAFMDEAKDQDFTRENDIPMIRINHNAAAFTLGGQTFGPTVEGYVLHYFQQRGWWEGKYKPGSAEPPDCASPDCVTPYPDSKKQQAPTCAECPRSEFGSAENGNAQACKVSTFFLLLNPDSFAPHGIAALVVPPTSIKSMIGTQNSMGYLGAAKQFRAPGGPQMGMYQLVFGRFKLQRIEGTPACQVVGEPVSMIPSVAEAKALGQLRGKIIAAFDALRKKIKGDPEDPASDPKKDDEPDAF